MPMTKIMSAIFVTLYLVSPRGIASGYRVDLAGAWSQSSVVVLVRPQLDRVSDLEIIDAERGYYSMNAQRAYKGGQAGDRIEFIDPFFRSTAGLSIQEGSNYVVFVQTIEDRKKRPHPATKSLGPALTGLCALKVNDETLAEVEAGIMIIKEYETLPPQDRKAFLLQNLAVTNAYSHTFIVREILVEGVKEAIPYFQQKLSQATNEADRLDLIAKLRCLGDPSVKDKLLAWLADDSFRRKVEIVEEIVRLKDASLTPTIRNYIDAKDDLLAVEARSALLRLGDPEGKSLCLAMVVRKDIGPTARYNAIHYLHWGYSGDFTEEEKSVLRDLVNDKEPSIARVAGFIVEKWKPMSDKPSEAIPQ